MCCKPDSSSHAIIRCSFWLESRPITTHYVDWSLHTGGHTTTYLRISFCLFVCLPVGCPRVIPYHTGHVYNIPWPQNRLRSWCYMRDSLLNFLLDFFSDIKWRRAIDLVISLVKNMTFVCHTAEQKPVWWQEFCCGWSADPEQSTGFIAWH